MIAEDGPDTLHWRPGWGSAEGAYCLDAATADFEVDCDAPDAVLTPPPPQICERNPDGSRGHCLGGERPPKRPKDYATPEEAIAHPPAVLPAVCKRRDFETHCTVAVRVRWGKPGDPTSRRWTSLWAPRAEISCRSRGAFNTRVNCATPQSVPVWNDGWSGFYPTPAAALAAAEPAPARCVMPGYVRCVLALTSVTYDSDAASAPKWVSVWAFSEDTVCRSGSGQVHLSKEIDCEAAGAVRHYRPQPIVRPIAYPTPWEGLRHPTARPKDCAQGTCVLVASVLWEDEVLWQSAWARPDEVVCRTLDDLSRRLDCTTHSGFRMRDDGWSERYPTPQEALRNMAPVPGHCRDAKGANGCVPAVADNLHYPSDPDHKRGEWQSNWLKPGETRCYAGPLGKGPQVPCDQPGAIRRYMPLQVREPEKRG